MTRPDRVLATDENFEEQLYLLANRDVARHVEAGGDAWVHFDRHGRREKRHQATPEAAGLSGSRAERKYRRFRDTLDSSRGSGGDFCFVNHAEAFPIAYGGEPHALADYDAESANPGFGDFIAECLAHTDRNYLEIGCGRRSRKLDNCLYLDVYPSVSADIIIAPACRYPIADESLDGIGCFAVLEHVTEPWIVAAELHRMLKPGGLIFIDYPFLVPVHGYPSHYYNATRAGLSRLFEEGFETLLLDTLDNQTPDHSIRWQLGGLTEALNDDNIREELLGKTVRDLIAEAPGGDFWRRILAATPERARADYAAGNTLIARKL